MKVIIAGSRTINNYDLVSQAIKESGFEITEVVSGGAHGVDQSGERWGKLNSVPIKIFRAEWNKLGKFAGPTRNKQMAQYADALVLVWDGKSRGSKSMLDEATKRGLKIYVKRV